jgi:acyl-coenzyme A thioesterase PaaI-like protein
MTTTQHFTRNLELMKNKHHKECMFNKNLIPLETDFSFDGSLTADFHCDPKLQGYPGIFHGGVLSAILDSVMTQCLFGNGMAGYTARLHIQYRKPVKTGNSACASAQINKNTLDKVVDLEASVIQNGTTCVTATAKFWIFDTITHSLAENSR